MSSAHDMYRVDWNLISIYIYILDKFGSSCLYISEKHVFVSPGGAPLYPAPNSEQYCGISASVAPTATPFVQQNDILCFRRA